MAYHFVAPSEFDRMVRHGELLEHNAHFSASYGTPQSLGCVEMPLEEAASVYPYTPIGTLVSVVS